LPLARKVYSLLAHTTFALRKPFCRVSERPIIILGNQKSGTTAIAALLARMTGTSVTLDLTLEVLRPSWEKLRSGSLSFSRFIDRNKLSFSRKIIKEPGLTLFFDELVGQFPDARFVFIVRDPRDNIRSILDRLHIPGNVPRLEPGHWAEIPHVWQPVLDGRWLELHGENFIDMLALRWNLLADTYLNNPEKMHLVRYEDFRSSKVAVIADLAETLGLERFYDIGNLVDKPFQPPGNAGVAWETYFGSENLERINHTCRTRMDRFGYHETVRNVAHAQP
jgi:hypothetical protein